MVNGWSPGVKITHSTLSPCPIWICHSKSVPPSSLHLLLANPHLHRSVCSCLCGITSAACQEEEMCFSAIFIHVISCKWGKEKALEKYGVSNAFSAITKTSWGYSAVSEKLFGTEIQGLPLVYSQEEIKANTISHPVFLRAEWQLEGKFFTCRRPSVSLEGFSKLNILLPKTWERKRPI